MIVKFSFLIFFFYFSWLSAAQNSLGPRSFFSFICGWLLLSAALFCCHYCSDLLSIYRCLAELLRFLLFPPLLFHPLGDHGQPEKNTLKIERADWLPLTARLFLTYFLVFHYYYTVDIVATRKGKRKTEKMVSPKRVGNKTSMASLSYCQFFWFSWFSSWPVFLVFLLSHQTAVSAYQLGLSRRLMAI